MATYKGHDIPLPDRDAGDRKLVGKRLPGTTIDEDAWGLPDEAGTERVRRPGEKGYMDTKPGAAKDKKIPVKSLDYLLKQNTTPLSNDPPETDFEPLDDIDWKTGKPIPVKKLKAGGTVKAGKWPVGQNSWRR